MSDEKITDPNELKKQQEEAESGNQSGKTLDEIETGNDILEPGEEVTWNHEAFPDKEFVFVVPSAREYRSTIPSEKIGATEDGDIQFDPTVIDPLLQQYCSPTPNLDEMSPGQFKALETAFYNFVQSFRRSDAKAASQG